MDLLGSASLFEKETSPDMGVDHSTSALSLTTGPGLASVTGTGLKTRLAVDMGIVRGLAGVHRDVSCEMRAAQI